MKKSLGKHLNNKGMTLVEVLLTLTVLSIMMIPIFNNFTESMRINNRTMTTISANHIGQQTLEMLKSDEDLVSFTKVVGDDDDAFDEQYTGEVEGYDVVATLTKVPDLAYAPDTSKKVNLGNEIDLESPGLEVVYQKEDGGNNYFTFNGEAQKHEYLWTKIELSDNGSAVNAKLIGLTESGGSWSEVNTGQSKNISPSEGKVSLVVKVDGQPDSGRIDVINKSASEVLLYEVDDNTAALKVVPKIIANKGDITLYRNVKSEAADADNERVVYNVDVQISKNSKVLERLVGTVVK